MLSIPSAKRSISLRDLSLSPDSPAAFPSKGSLNFPTRCSYSYDATGSASPTEAKAPALDQPPLERKRPDDTIVPEERHPRPDPAPLHLASSLLGIPAELASLKEFE